MKNTYSDYVCKNVIYYQIKMHNIIFEGHIILTQWPCHNHEEAWIIFIAVQELQVEVQYQVQYAMTKMTNETESTLLQNINSKRTSLCFSRISNHGAWNTPKSIRFKFILLRKLELIVTLVCNSAYIWYIG